MNTPKQNSEAAAAARYLRSIGLRVIFNKITGDWTAYRHGCTFTANDEKVVATAKELGWVTS